MSILRNSSSAWNLLVKVNAGYIFAEFNHCDNYSNIVQYFVYV